jgi:hypothetical protein
MASANYAMMLSVIYFTADIYFSQLYATEMKETVYRPENDNHDLKHL